MKKIIMLGLSTFMAMGLVGCNTPTEQAAVTSEKEVESNEKVETEPVEETSNDNRYDVGDFSFTVPAGWTPTPVNDIVDPTQVYTDEIVLENDNADYSISLFVVDDSIEDAMYIASDLYSPFHEYDFPVDGRETKAATGEWDSGENTTYLNFIFYKDGEKTCELSTNTKNPDCTIDKELLTSIIQSVHTK